MKKSNGGKNTALYEEERNIMAKTSSPWLTKLDYAFQVKFSITSHPYTRGFVHLTKSKTFQLFSSQYAAWYTCTHSIRRINSYTSNSFFYWIAKHSEPLFEYMLPVL